MKIRTIIGTVGFAALLATTGVAPTVPAEAQRWEDCHDRIRHAERHLDRMIERYGHRSREAHRARRDLDDVRDWCRRHDRRDRDRDHDRRGWDGPHRY